MSLLSANANNRCVLLFTGPRGQLFDDASELILFFSVITITIMHFQPYWVYAGL